MTDTAITTTAGRELPLPAGGSVDINLAAADVRVRGTDGDRIVVRTRNGEPMGSDIRIDVAGSVVHIRDGEGIVKLGPLLIGTRRSPSLDIDLPRSAAVSLRTLSGDVEASGIGGASRWASASGDLRVATSAGPVRLETMSGDAILEASAAIALAARTVSGNLRIRAPRLDALDASTTSGDIQVEADLAAEARHSVSSVSGDVSIATASPVRMEAQTIAGDVRASGPHASDGARGRRTFVAGNGSVALSVRTTSGDVRLRVLGAPSSVLPAVVPSSVVPTASPAHGAPARPEPPIAPVPPVAPAIPTRPTAPDAPVPSAWTVPGPGVPDPDEETRAWNAPESAEVRREAARLDILRALERGDLDIEAASRRLEALEEAGPRSFRGWC